jgi:serine/threonine-protein kinase HipA
MNKAKVYVNGVFAGILTEVKKRTSYEFNYNENYKGGPVSLTMPVKDKVFVFDKFPPFFEGLLPEGLLLESLLKRKKIDRDDLFLQLITVGKDMIGDVTIDGAETDE